MLFSLSSKDPDPIKGEYYFNQIKDFKNKLHLRNKQIDKYSQKILNYSITNFDPSILLGTISYQTSIEHIKHSINDDNSHNEIKIIEEEEEEDEISDTESIKPIEIQKETEIPKCENPTPPITPTLENLPNKKLLWSLNFKFVPQYISLYRQSILFASDRWGFVR